MKLKHMVHIPGLTLFCALMAIVFQVLPALAADEPAKIIQQRAQEFWDLKIKQQYDQAYKYENPETIKDVSLTKYTRSVGSGVRWLKAHAEVGEVKDDKARVRITLRFCWTFVDKCPPDGFESGFWENWTRVDGIWYHNYRAPLDPRTGQAIPSSDQSEKPKETGSSSEPPKKTE